MLKRKKTIEEINDGFKKDIRRWVREYPSLYKNLKEYSRKYHGDIDFIFMYLHKDYNWLKDPDGCRKYEEEKKVVEARAAAQKTRQELDEYNAKSRPNAVQCPYCKSWQTEKIGTGERVVSIAVAGPASGKIGKQFHCNKCGANF